MDESYFFAEPAAVAAAPSAATYVASAAYAAPRDARTDSPTPSMTGEPPAKRSRLMDEEESSRRDVMVSASLDDALDLLSGKIKFSSSMSSMSGEDDDDDDDDIDACAIMNSITKTCQDEDEALQAQAAARYCDPLTSLFPEEVLYRITSFLDVPDLLLRLGATNRHYRTVCQRDEAGWTRLCEALWKDKIHVAAAARDNNTNNNNNNNMCAAYRLSLTDSHRQHVTMEEFCYDLSGTIWSFRFKESAGDDWTTNDPWYAGRPCRKFVFLQDGTVQSVVQSNNNNNISAAANVELTDPPMRMTWRFLTRPMDLPNRPMGSYVRFTVGGRDVPTYAVRRSPTGNWGFVLESCWGVYASFELPPKQQQQRPLQRQQQGNDNNNQDAGIVLRRRPGGVGGAVWVHNNNDTVEAVAAAAMQDDSLTLTNEIQWREAFLYNVGARVLPEGDEATDEFDRAWQDAHNAG